MARDKAALNVNYEHDKIDRLFEELEVDGSVSYSADYAGHVEFPTEYKGTQPPFAPLYEWVERKWNDLDNSLKDVPLYDENGERNDIAEGSTEHRRAVAWVVVKSIADDGTDGVFYMRRSYEAAKDAGEQFLEQFEHSDDIEAPRKIFEQTLDFAFEQSQKIVAEEATDRGNLLQSGRAVVNRDGQEVFEKEGGN